MERAKIADVMESKKYQEKEIIIKQVRKDWIYDSLVILLGRYNRFNIIGVFYNGRYCLCHSGKYQISIWHLYRHNLRTTAW